MTPDRPTGAELLELARAVFQRDILPALPDDRRLTALMVLNVMGIAAREITAGEAPRNAIAARLADLYGAGEPDTLFRRLAAGIRAGEFDEGSRHEAVRALLWELAKAKAHAANLRLLTAQGLE
jgi:hypothetical protein